MFKFLENFWEKIGSPLEESKTKTNPTPSQPNIGPTYVFWLLTHIYLIIYLLYKNCIYIKTPSKILRPPQNSKEYVTPLRCSAPAYVFASFYFKNIPPVGFNATYIEIFLPFTAKISHFWPLVSPRFPRILYK